MYVYLKGIIIKKYFFVPIIVYLLIGCSKGYIIKNGYKMPANIDTSDITIQKILKEDKDELDKGLITIDSVIDARVAKETNLKLKYLDGKVNRIKLIVSTRGGWLKDTFNIIDTINSISTPVDIYAKDLCQSAGVVLLISASGKRYAFNNSTIVPHFNRPLNPKPNTQAYFDNLRFTNIWREKTSIPNNWYPLSGNRLIRLTPKEAKEYRIIDEIIN